MRKGKNQIFQSKEPPAAPKVAWACLEPTPDEPRGLQMDKFTEQDKAGQYVVDHPDEKAYAWPTMFRPPDADGVQVVDEMKELSEVKSGAS